MLVAKQFGTEAAPTADEVRAAMRAMNELGWVPAAVATEDHFLSLAGLEAGSVGAELRMGARRYRPDDTPSGDVFFTDAELFFCIRPGLEGRDLDEPWETRRPGSPVRLPPLLVGIVTEDDENAESRLGEFASAIEGALGKVMDGRRFRHLNFDWAPVSSGQDRVAALVERLTEEGAEPSFKEPQLGEDEIAASRVLAGEAARRLLVELATAGGFAREADVLARRGDKEEEVRASLEELKGGGLLRNEYLVQCRSTSTALTRIDEMSALEDPAVASLRCANCSRQYSEELCVPGLQVSPLGKNLLDGSHWMTVWVTDRLMELGVPEENIAWNLAESSEEIDILVEVAGQLWILELKDRDFGPGDAYPFSYRRSRYAPDDALILTTGRVSNDAKKVFEELAREERGPRGVEPVLIEGLDEVDTAFRRGLRRATMRRALMVMQPVARATGFQVQRIVLQRYGTDNAS